MKVWNKRHGNAPEGAVYVGRPTRFGNPFVIGKDGDRAEVIRKYEAWVSTAGLDLSVLRGKDLVCWCAPEGCHADVLLRLANGPDGGGDVKVGRREEKVEAIREFRGEWGWLSNFAEAPLVWEGRSYRCSEAAFQAAKSLDEGVRRGFADLDGREAKHEGRRVDLRSDWMEVRLEVMLSVLRAKFLPGSELAVKLVGTDPALLVEGNWWGDRFWGVSDGVGENWLGRLLMRVRDELKGPDGGGDMEVKDVAEVDCVHGLTTLTCVLCRRVQDWTEPRPYIPEGDDTGYFQLVHGRKVVWIPRPAPRYDRGEASGCPKGDWEYQPPKRGWRKGFTNKVDAWHAHQNEVVSRAANGPFCGRTAGEKLVSLREDSEMAIDVERDTAEWYDNDPDVVSWTYSD